jgi:hypothetical protein
MPSGNHGPSIKNPATYEALKRQGMSKTQAARISNGALRKGYCKGAHGGSACARAKRGRR